MSNRTGDLALGQRGWADDEEQNNEASRQRDKTGQGRNDKLGRGRYAGWTQAGWQDEQRKAGWPPQLKIFSFYAELTHRWFSSGFCLFLCRLPLRLPTRLFDPWWLNSPGNAPPLGGYNPDPLRSGGLQSSPLLSHAVPLALGCRGLQRGFSHNFLNHNPWLTITKHHPCMMHMQTRQFLSWHFPAFTSRWLSARI